MAAMVPIQIEIRPKLAFVLAIVALCLPSESLGQLGTSRTQNESAEVTKAREKHKASERRYSTLKELNESGSVSFSELRIADFNRKVALLELSSLLSPEHKSRNLLIKAKMIFNLRSDQLKTAQKLYLRGSVTKVEFRRAETAVEIARANLKAVQSYSETQRKMQVISAAKSKLELAQQEIEIAKKLYEQRSLSQPAYDRAVSNLTIAESELQSAKAALRARAYQLKQ